MSAPRIKAIVFEHLDQRLEVKGQVARTLAALINAGKAGVTAGEVCSWALRLAHYVMCLRRLGLPIDMALEPHRDGNHGRYRLLVDVRILSVEHERAEVAA
jgi:hypothetical protein